MAERPISAATSAALPARTLRDLRPGDQATICCLQDPEMALKLLEMGCVPGQRVRLRARAPLGGPITVVVGDEEYILSLRREEAATILLKEIE
jgi:ferrous iron transport protein A